MNGCTDVDFADGETRIICNDTNDVYLKDFRGDFVRVGTYTNSDSGYSFEEDDETASQDAFSNRRRLQSLEGKMYGLAKKGGKRTKRRNNKKRSHKKRSHRKRMSRRR
jgi:hypothetical protein